MKAKENIEKEVVRIMDAEKALANLEAELAENPKFHQFLRAQKSFKEESERLWKEIEAAMIANDIRSIKGEWGSVTVAERLTFEIDKQALPKKYYKQVVDTKKLADTFRLEGTAPKGTVPRYTKYITRRLK